LLIETRTLRFLDSLFQRYSGGKGRGRTVS